MTVQSDLCLARPRHHHVRTAKGIRRVQVWSGASHVARAIPSAWRVLSTYISRTALLHLKDIQFAIHGLTRHLVYDSVDLLWRKPSVSQFLPERKNGEPKSVPGRRPEARLGALKSM